MIPFYRLSVVGLVYIATIVAAISSSDEIDESVPDFTITCETDLIVLDLEELDFPESIVRGASFVRSCTVNTFGLFDDNIALSCDSSSLSGVDCEVSPSYVTVARNPSESEIAVIINATGDALAEEDLRGEVLVSATYRTSERSSSIPVCNHPVDVDDGSSIIEGGADFFLLGGQSNMYGHTTSGQSFGSNDQYWKKVKSILDDGRDPSVMETYLKYVIQEEKVAKNDKWPESLANKLATETMTLYKKGLLNNLDTPLKLGSCSFVIPQQAGGLEYRSGGTKSTVWDADCGGIFGHELTFSRTLEIEMGQQTSFETVKNSRGGTQIHKHWYPGYGLYWDQLRSSIASRKGLGNWKGFIWHQGTQEAWADEDTSLTYLGNLTGLINEVRIEMFDASEDGYWQCKEEIPVVVVQIGYWPQNARAQRVREAQEQYCDGDPRAELAIMYDLGRFYHFDPPSFLIGGNRIAQAYQAAVQASVTCPTAFNAAPPDFTITCQTDLLVLEEVDVPASIVRTCTVNTFGIFTDNIELSCDPSSLAGVDCGVTPSYITVANNPSETEVVVTIRATSDALGEKDTRGEILVSATYATSERSSSIHVCHHPVEVDVENGSNIIEGAVDFFLLGGQSNMHGHTTSGQSIVSSDKYWRKVKSILDAGTDPVVMETYLRYVINAVQLAKNDKWPESVAIKLANETMKMYNKGLLNNLDIPLNLGNCSFVIPQQAGGVEYRSNGTKATVWDAGCGGSFGHELTFSRTLELEMGQQTSFETVKNSRGGTQIYKHWYPGNGLYWDQLKSSITGRKGLGNWKGFIWHQGTQEAWTDEDTSLTYLGNLTGLINGVRTEMFDASEDGYWQCKEEIPVVVVQIGYWPQNARAQRVREAQAQYCNEDPRAELAIMYDLGRFYHFDPPSFLIGGNRIAQAYQTAAQASVTCPTALNTAL